MGSLKWSGRIVALSLVLMLVLLYPLKNFRRCVAAHLALEEEKEFPNEGTGHRIERYQLEFTL